jgi:poly-gamma-glutamate synthesis protein (capsule biosynthesis protein)
MAQIVAAMEAEGAEVTMLYIHWGDEYYLEENYRQNDIAQKTCDMGIDVIVGGHPHVVQPMELLESTVDPDHKTICIYSVGNVVSNQRLGNISQIDTPHTEDGALFSVTFEKYTDGRVYVAEVDVLPTWVNMYRNENDKTVYAILPLEEERREEWAELFDLPGAILTAAENSYDRTMKIVGEGLSQCQTYLEQQKLAREQYYIDLAAGNAA